ncbi:suppressor of cytokine signaling 2-like isoform X2 [Onthophagus taurus]|nr:suppressor of cytokine signaling 2-like isoform X2 [Onthophagus taurus]
MLGCNAECPKCQHHFVCCPPTPCCAAAAINVRHSLHGFTGGNIEFHHVNQRASLSPQVSPSLPLEFVLPPIVSRQQHQQQQPQNCRPPTKVHKTHPERIQALRQSGWYYGAITYQQSQELLQNKSVGTFLVRDSSDPRFMFSLSVQTEKGPTSIRLHFVEGCFKLDSQPHLLQVMPKFNSVPELIEHYVKSSKNDNHVWVDPAGKLHSAIVIKRPLPKGNGPPSLKHLSRMSVHSVLQQNVNGDGVLRDPIAYKKLALPQQLINYLDEYPYTI